MSTTNQTPRAMSRWRRLLYYLGMILFPVVAFVLAARLFGPGVRAEVGGPRLIVEAAGRLVVGIVVLAVAACLYGIATLTCNFTFDYKRPVFKAYKPKAVLAHILVPVPVSLGLGVLLAGMLQILFALLGLDLDSLIPGVIIALLLTNIGMVRLNIWAPNERNLPRQRLNALGISDTELERGTYVGISDPTNNTIRSTKGMLEEDIGMLWIESGRLVYRGDAESIVIPRERLLEIERVVFGRSVTAYAGNRHIVLRFQTDRGSERRMRLHVEGLWTMGRLVRATDELANRLTTWKEHSAAA